MTSLKKILFLISQRQIFKKQVYIKAFFFKKVSSQIHLVPGSTTNCNNSVNGMTTQQGHCTLIKDLNNIQLFLPNKAWKVILIQDFYRNS